MKAVVYSCAVGSAMAAPTNDVLAKFEEFRVKWGHNYVGLEYQRRLNYFGQNLDEIDKLRRNERGTAVYSHLGPFADYSPDEMAQRSGFLQAEMSPEIPTTMVPNVTLSSSFDWVAKGAVNPVKNQGECGSCWTFSTVANLEGTGFVSAGKLVSLSEQNILDCDKSGFSCLGGLPSKALAWTSKNGGVASEASYPYKGLIGEFESCKKDVDTLTHNTGYIKISKHEDQIAAALVKYGPLSIAVDAKPFQLYHGGVLRPLWCSKTRLDHAVNIVGYGQTSIQYWKIRNSWGAKWGEDGYIRVYRGDCTCGLCTLVVTATGVTIKDDPPREDKSSALSSKSAKPLTNLTLRTRAEVVV